MNIKATDGYLPIEEVSRRLCIAVGTARNRLCNGEPMPPSIRVGRRRLFLESDFNDWVRTFHGIQSVNRINGDGES